MKSYKQILFILIVFFKTETLFSENNLFNVNNIKIEKKDKTKNNKLTDQAIKKGFNKLITKILLKEDKDKLSDLDFSSIKQLVTYYQITNISDDEKKDESFNFNITFDKDKIHNLFYNRSISYSEIFDKELYILPVFIKEDEIYVFNNNFFYENWNKIYKIDLIDFILPIENIEIIRNINNYKNNLINLRLSDLFEEYKDKNIALIFIEDNKKVFIKTSIQKKIISRSFKFKTENLNTEKIYENIITESKKELINLVKSQNLIDIRTPSFLNAKLNLNKNSNLVELNKRIKNIDSIENIFVQEFNKDYMNLKIKYLGKLDKIIDQLKKENIKLQIIKDQWIIRTL